MRMGFVLGVAIGYVLGSRAGRERYEQIVDFYRRVANNPSVRDVAGAARHKATGVVSARKQEPEQTAGQHG